MREVEAFGCRIVHLQPPSFLEIDRRLPGVEEFDPFVLLADLPLPGRSIEGDAVAPCGVVPVPLGIGDDLVDHDAALRRRQGLEGDRAGRFRFVSREIGKRDRGPVSRLRCQPRTAEAMVPRQVGTPDIRDPFLPAFTSRGEEFERGECRFRRDPGDHTAPRPTNEGRFADQCRGGRIGGHLEARRTSREGEEAPEERHTGENRTVHSTHSGISRHASHSPIPSWRASPSSVSK